MNEIFSSPEKFSQKLDALKKDGYENLHIITDFDKTLTKAKVNGQNTNSSFARIREGAFLPPEYVERATQLYKTYYPSEIDPNLSPEQRSILMSEWWTKHLSLLIEYGITEKVFETVIDHVGIHARDGMEELFSVVAEHKVPILVFSAGLGDFIRIYLQKKSLLTANVHVISNLFEFNSEGKAVGIKGTIIHPFNKHEIEVSDTPYAQEVRSRKNVIVLGDSLGDVGMAAGFKHDTVIKIGMLNGLYGMIRDYKEYYDVILQDEDTIQYVVDLVKSIAEK